MVFEGDTDQASKDMYEDTGVLQFERVDGVDYYWTTGTHLLELLTSDGVAYCASRATCSCGGTASVHDAVGDLPADDRGPAHRRVDGNALIRPV